ncbi:MAG: radical SAM family heme chaperone HemW [Gammaproteobacteria bacterium]|nr:radical SAM family heme chaperone HemW [Gammaproteobacteria bacterium]
MADSIPLSVYAHIPWCVRKCPYCDFNSHALTDDVDQAGYVGSLLRDLEIQLGDASGKLPVAESLFIGGGTPSLFGGAAIAQLVEGIDRLLGFAPAAEITLEANPGTAEAARFSDYRAAEVNRLSIGVQSLDDNRLAALGRIHDASEALAAARIARRAGFDNLNLDLMYGLPGQDVAAALDDLRGVLALEPSHLSWYQLTLEPNTWFHHRPPPGLPDEDGLADIMDAGQALIAAAGFVQYEVSAYAREGRRCRHNLNYWGFGDYLGIGAGAHGKLTGGAGTVIRTTRPRQPAAYSRAVANGEAAQRSPVPAAELPLEFMLNALRMNEGVAASWFTARTGLPGTAVSTPIAQARARGLLDPDPLWIRPTPLGQRFLNDLLVLFEPKEQPA